MSNAKYMKQALANMKKEIKSSMIERMSKRIESKKSPPLVEGGKVPEEEIEEEDEADTESLIDDEEDDQDDGELPASVVSTLRIATSRKEDPPAKRGPGRPRKAV